MKKIFAVMLVLTLLTTVFSFTLVDAKSKNVSLTGQIIEVNQGNAKNAENVLMLKCEDGNYILTGNIKGMSQYIKSMAKVNGDLYQVPADSSIVVVENYEIINELTNVVKKTPPIVTKEPIVKVTPPISTKEPIVRKTPLPIVTKEPVVTQLPTPGYERLMGTLFNDVSSKERFLLKTEKGVFELMGNIKGLESEIGKNIVVTGNYVYTLIPTEYPLFNVESYTVIEIPQITPEPNLQTITGTLTVTKPEAIGDTEAAYGYLLQTQTGPVSLRGKTEGLVKYDGLVIEVSGTYSMLEIYPPIFVVESYKPVSTPTPTPEVKTITIADNGGYVTVKPGDEVKIELESNPTTGYRWSYITKPDPEVLIETNYEYIPDKPYKTNEIIVGSGGKEVWSYKAANNGITLIEMTYSRPWELVAPVKTFAVKVIVEEFETISGTLTVTKPEVIDDTEAAYGYLLQTQTGPVSLSGKTEGLEKYDGLVIEVTGTYSMLKIYPPIFIVESYKPVSTPTPTPEVKTITIADNGGYVTVKPGDEVKIELESNPTTGYRWSYVTKPDPEVLIETNYEYIPDKPYKTNEIIVGSGGKEVWSYKAVNNGITLIEMTYSRPWESVTSAKAFAVKVIVEDLENISGTLTVTKIDIPEEKVSSYNYLLKTQSGPVTLNGKTEGLEKYDGLEVEVTGKYSMLKIYPPIFIVESYKLVSIPTPTPTIIPVPTVRPIPTAIPIPTGKPIPIPTLKPIPTVRPEPTALPVSKTHTIISEKILGIALPDANFADISGYTTISWIEGTKNAFFSSKIIAGKNVYEFELVSVITSDSERIVGLFNIKKNGELMEKEIKGELYGLSYGEGEYFKFYSEDTNSHMSAYITKRLDF